MKLTAKDLLEFKVIDKIIKEPIEMNEEDFQKVSENIKKEIKKETSRILKLSKEDIVEERYEKFRNIKEIKNYDL